jgi:hypothetical protein
MVVQMYKRVTRKEQVMRDEKYIQMETMKLD